MLFILALGLLSRGLLALTGRARRLAILRLGTRRLTHAGGRLGGAILLRLRSGLLACRLWRAVLLRLRSGLLTRRLRRAVLRLCSRLLVHAGSRLRCPILLSLYPRLFPCRLRWRTVLRSRVLLLGHACRLRRTI